MSKQGEETIVAGDLENNSTCKNCGRPIIRRYTGTFWKAPDPMPTAWYHDEIGYPLYCSWAEPSV